MLPTVASAVFEIHLHSLGKDVKFRRMRGSDEKQLLLAKLNDPSQLQDPIVRAENDRDVFLAVKTVVESCCDDISVDVNNLPIYDLEWAFIKLWEASVSSVVPFGIKDNYDEKDYFFNVPLKEIVVNIPNPDAKPEIKFNNTQGVVMHHPRADVKENFSDDLYARIARCITTIIDGPKKMPADAYPFPDLVKWVTDLESKVIQEMSDFLASAPTISHTIKYKLEDGVTERAYYIRSLSDFFTL